MVSCARAIGPHDESAVRRYLAQRPYENVYLEWLLTEQRPVRDRLFCYRDARDAIMGTAFFGRQVVLAAESAEAIACLANVAQEFGDERTIVAPRNTAHEFWDRVRGWHRPPRLLRDRQPIFVLESEPKAAPSQVSIRPARAGDSGEVARNSAAMIEHELGYDPRRIAGDFLENVDQMIERGMWWVGSSGGRLCFFCHVGPHSRQTVQLQGVWTPPALRGRGLARDALAQICRALLQRFPTVSLYVNDFNTAAIRLYRTVGFVEKGELATYLF
jgi:uncharacterized protein